MRSLKSAPSPQQRIADSRIAAFARSENAK